VIDTIHDAAASWREGRDSLIAATWRESAEQVARFVWKNLVNRTDVWGSYRVFLERGKEYIDASGQTKKCGTATTRPAKKERGRVALTPGKITRHFMPVSPADLVGLHSTSQENTSRWGAVEIDWHGENSTDPDVNWRAARGWYDELVRLGIRPLLTDSNGRGGFHLLTFFDDPVSTPTVYCFLNWLTSNHERYGLPAAPETFPKQASIQPGRFGNYLRLFGLHHTRAHWSRVWSGSSWLDGQEAIDFILNLIPSSASFIPANMNTIDRRIEAYMAKLPSLQEGQGRDDVAFNFACFLVRDLAVDDLTALQWLGRWDNGNRPPKGPDRLSEILANAHQYGQHGYGSGLNGNGHSRQKTNGVQHPQQEQAGEKLAELLDKLKENVEQAVEEALQPAALQALGLLALDDAGRVELLYRELRKSGAKSRDVDGLRRAVNQERKQIKQERQDQARERVQLIPRSVRLLTNYSEEKVNTPKGPQVTKAGRPPCVITLELLGLTKGWPRRRGQSLFAESDHVPLWLDNPASLFAWIHNYVGDEKGSGIYWTGEGDNMVSRVEFHAYLTQSVENYRAVEVFPHWPTMAEHFYIHPPVEGGDGEALRHLVHRFSPATLADHDLIEALFLSLLWGGAPGNRPAWLITSDEEDGEAGRGVGKSFLAQFAAELVGGYVALDSEDKMPDLMKRLLSPEGQLKRVLLLDNLKTLKFSWSQLEALITQTIISGHQLYEGEGSRPNTLTTIITLNGASLSKDMAQRCAIVKLTRPKYSATWEEETRQYIQTHRWAIVGDILAKLQAPGKGAWQSDRWASWGRDVLSRVSDPAECQKVLQERRGDVDEDSAEGDTVRDYFAARLIEREHNAAKDVVFIPSAVVGEWVNGATGERRAVAKACSYLNQLKVKGLKRSKHEGRGFIWTGNDSQPAQKAAKLKDPPYQEHHATFR